MIRDRLFDCSPYDGFDPAPYPEDLQGWGSHHPLLAEAIQVVRPRLVCEVGSWKGRSAINMARAVKQLGLDTEIVCVDTWLGSPEHWLKMDPAWYDSLRIRNGLPQLYYTFLANVVRAQLSDVITPFPNTSENAAAIFRHLDVKFDLIYLDAAHQYEAVKRDLNIYYDLLADDGLMIGDDYIDWAEVTRAVDDFAIERRLKIFGQRGKYVLPKGGITAGIVLSRNIVEFTNQPGPAGG